MAIASYAALAALVLQSILTQPSTVTAKLGKHKRENKPSNRRLKHHRPIPLPLPDTIKEANKNNPIDLPLDSLPTDTYCRRCRSR